jgi:hypothetical protein
MRVTAFLLPRRTWPPLRARPRALPLGATASMTPTPGSRSSSPSKKWVTCSGVRWVSFGAPCSIEALPLYQSIQLIRGPALGSFDVPALTSAACYLAAFGTAGMIIATRRLGKLLLK